MEKLQDMFNQKAQDALKKYQDTTNKKPEKTQKQLNEFRKDFHKLQSETKETIKKKDIHEIKKTTRDMKEEFSNYMENLRKKESNRHHGNKKFLTSNKKYRGKPLQQTRTSRRHNLRT
jgi:predicted  nucleic acid-binding Zn-ribbon protein